MHIPDGLMHPLVLLIGWAIAIVVIVLSVRLLNKKLPYRQLPTMAVIGGGIFVAQMLNFPIGGGTTGHLVGAALAAILLGPVAGFVIIVTILIIQAFLFGDGGVTALGLNIFNMAFIGCFVGWGVYRAVPEKYQRFGILLASWISVFVMSLAAAVELSVSHSISGGAFGITAVISFPSMLIFHAIIGIGEALITLGVISYISTVSPEMIHTGQIRPKTGEAVSE